MAKFVIDDTPPLAELEMVQRRLMTLMHKARVSAGKSRKSMAVAIFARARRDCQLLIETVNQGMKHMPAEGPAQQPPKT